MVGLGGVVLRVVVAEAVVVLAAFFAKGTGKGAAYGYPCVVACGDVYLLRIYPLQAILHQCMVGIVRTGAVHGWRGIGKIVEEAQGLVIINPIRVVTIPAEAGYVFRGRVYTQLQVAE